MNPLTPRFATLLVLLAFLAGGCRCFTRSPDAARDGVAASPDSVTGVVFRAYARYSCYTTEPKAEVVCEIGLPEADLAASVLVAKGATGRKLAALKDIRPRTLLLIPIARLAPGSVTVTVDWQRQDGVTLARREVTILKRPPKPGCEWKIDRADKAILNNGAPFFPFGIMMNVRASMDQEAAFKEVADAGFNTVVRWHRHPLDDIEILYAMAKKYNFYVVETPGNWRDKALEDAIYQKTPWQPGLEWALQNLYPVFYPALLKRIMNNPNFMSTYLADEPGDNRDSAAATLRIYNLFNAADGYHPAEILYSGVVPEGDEFSGNCDILGMDSYWPPGAGAKNELGNPNRVGRMTWETRRRADRDLKLAWITPCAEQSSDMNLRILNENEQRVQTYLALIQGAKGLLYFVYPFHSQTTYDTFVRLGREMKTLGPACAAPDLPQTIRYTPVGFDPLNRVFPDVQVSLKKNPSGGYILLAANYRPYPVDVAYKLSVPGLTGTIRLLFNKERSFKVEQGRFADTLEAMDTRAYAIEGPTELSGALEIAVDLKAHPEKTDSTYTKEAIPLTGAPGKKNVLRNSGFEESSIPGMPDYYRDMRTAKTALGYRLGDSRGDCDWSLDMDRPYEGKYSLRLKGNGAFLLFGVGTKLDRPTPYTFSVYARADREGMTFRYYGPEDHSRAKVFPLTTQWQRFSETITLPAKCPWGGHCIGFSTGSSTGEPPTVWFDAMQLEKGEELTEYQQ